MLVLSEVRSAAEFILVAASSLSMTSSKRLGEVGGGDPESRFSFAFPLRVSPRLETRDTKPTKCADECFPTAGPVLNG